MGLSHRMVHLEKRASDRCFKNSQFMFHWKNKTTYQTTPLIFAKILEGPTPDLSFSSISLIYLHWEVIPPSCLKSLMRLTHLPSMLSISTIHQSVCERESPIGAVFTLGPLSFKPAVSTFFPPPTPFVLFFHLYVQMAWCHPDPGARPIGRLMTDALLCSGAFWPAQDGVWPYAFGQSKSLPFRGLSVSENTRCSPVCAPGFRILNQSSALCYQSMRKKKHSLA